MQDDLTKLVEAARGVAMTSEQRERQRQSFAFGNANIENSFVTRDTVKRVAAEMRQSDEQGTRK